MDNNICKYLSNRSIGTVGFGRKLPQIVKDNKSIIQRLRLEKNLAVHSGCVNSIQWNEKGSYILSGSDDRRVLITDPFSHGGYKVLADIKTLHRSNIFCTLFLPNTSDTRIVSCAGDGCIIVSDTTRAQDFDNQIARFNCHQATCYELLAIDADTFMSCGEDKTVRFYDIREKNRCSCSVKTNDRRSYLEPLIHTPRPVTCISSHPLKSYEIAVGVADSSIYIHDRRMVKNVTDSSSLGPITSALDRLSIERITDRLCRVTSVNYSLDGLNILASFSSDYIYLFSTQNTSEPPLEYEKPIQTVLKVPEKVTGKKLKKLRLRGSDTGPFSRPSNEQEQGQGQGQIAQARPHLHTSLMERMTLVLSQMLSSVPDDVDIPSQLDSENPIESELANLRSDFIQRHHIEPAVNLAYRTGEPSGRISLHPANELERQSQPETEQLPPPNSSSVHSSEYLSNQNSTSNITQMEVEKEFKDLTDMRIVMKYDGHRNSRTMIKEANFWGSKYIISGSDCGHIFFWDRTSGELVKTLEADKHVVNKIKPHPLYAILASSGIDYDIKIFSPSLEEEEFDVIKAEELKKRNAIMLKESQDSICVPATFMIRMLSCLSHIRSTSRASNNNSSNNNDNDDTHHDLPSSSSSSQ